MHEEAENIYDSIEWPGNLTAWKMYEYLNELYNLSENPYFGGSLFYSDGGDDDVLDEPAEGLDNLIITYFVVDNEFVNVIDKFVQSEKQEVSETNNENKETSDPLLSGLNFDQVWFKLGEKFLKYIKSQFSAELNALAAQYGDTSVEELLKFNNHKYSWKIWKADRDRCTVCGEKDKKACLEKQANQHAGKTAVVQLKKKQDAIYKFIESNYVKPRGGEQEKTKRSRVIEAIKVSKYYKTKKAQGGARKPKRRKRKSRKRRKPRRRKSRKRRKSRRRKRKSRKRKVLTRTPRFRQKTKRI